MYLYFKGYPKIRKPKQNQKYRGPVRKLISKHRECQNETFFLDHPKLDGEWLSVSAVGNNFIRNNMDEVMFSGIWKINSNPSAHVSYLGDRNKSFRGSNGLCDILMQEIESFNETKGLLCAAACHDLKLFGII